MSQEQRNQLIINVSQEDIAFLASVLAQVLRYQNDAEYRQLVDRAYVLPLEFLDQLDLEAISSAVAGVTDPIGQLKKWLEEQLKKFVKWIVDQIAKLFTAVEDFIKAVWNRFFKPAIEAVVRFLKETVWEKWIAPWFDTIWKGIGTVLDAIKSVGDAIGRIADALKKVVVDPILKALNWIKENFPKIVEKVGDLLKAIASFLRELPDKVSEAIKAIAEKIGDAFRGLIDAVRKAIDLVTDFIRSLPDKIEEFFEWLSKQFGKLGDLVGNVIKAVTDFIKSLPEKIEGFFKWLGKQFRGVAKALGDALKPVVSAISELPKKVAGFIEWLGKQIGGLGKAIGDAVKLVSDFIAELPKRIGGFFKWLADRFSDLGRLIAGAIRTVQGFIASLPRRIESFVKWLAGRFAELGNLLAKVFDMIRGFVAMIADKIGSFLDWLGKQIHNVVNAISGIIDAIAGIPKAVASAVSEIVDVVRKAWESLVREITKWWEGFLETVKRVASIVLKLPEAVSKTMRVLLDAVANLPKVASRAIENVEKWVWEHLPDWARRFLEEAPKALMHVGTVIQGFVNAILKFPEWFPKWFYEHIAKPIADALRGFARWVWDNLPGWLRDALTAIGSFFSRAGEAVVNIFTRIWQGMQSFARDPARWFYDNVLLPLWGAARWLAEEVIRGVGWFVERLGDLGNVVIGAMSALGKWMVGAIERLFDVVADLIHSATRVAVAVIGRLFSVFTARRSPSPLEELQSQLSATMSTVIAPPLNMYRDMISKVVSKKELNPVEFLYNIVNFGVLAAVALFGVWMLVRPFIEAIPDTELALRQLGLGPAFRSCLRRVFEGFIEEARRIFPEVSRYLIIGHMIWWAEPTRAITRQWLTEYLTVELPPLEHALYAVRRRLVTPKVMEYYDMFARQLRMGGIYKGFIEALYPLPPKLVDRFWGALSGLSGFYDEETQSIVVVDRFGKPRLFPTTLIAQIPTPSELARMMIRDIIQDPRYFAAVMAMHGFTPDTAFMFYLLHFRYPPPEKLWEFTCRGIAGELWFDASKVMDPETGRKLIEVAASEAGSIGAFAPVSPVDLNFKPSALFAALSRYMKWHDYARFSWIKGFTSDNFIVIDLLADIPTKIDLRWMTRWGMFDYWSAHGVGLKTAIHEITRGLIPDGATLQAKPLIDRYLKYLQSGEIVFDLRQFCRVLQATGIHPYWIPWVAIAESINALTEERTLLRTGFINLYKEGIWDLNRLNELLSGFFTVKFRVGYFDMEKNDWASATVEYPVAFLPAESKLLELRAVMDRALDIYREAYRAVIGAVRTYVLTPDEAKKKLRELVNAINESFFVRTIKAISGRELALVLDEGYFNAWSTYAELLADVEARERTRFYARYLLWSVLWGLRLGYTSEEEAREWVDKLVKTMHEHEYVKQAIWISVDFMIQRFFKEIRVRAVVNLLRSRRISLEEAITELKKLGFSEDVAKSYIDANVVWYTPGLTTYATLLEIVPEAINMSLRAIEHFNLPKDEEPFWRLYIARKPIQDELTLLRTRIYNALAVGMSIEEVVAILSRYAMVFKFERGELKIEGAEEARKLLEFYERHKAVFQAFGIAPHEWVMYNVIARFEERIDELRQAVRERIPSPSTLAVLAEYLVLPRELVLEALRRYRVAEEWIPIWLRYIEVKPIKSDAKSLLGVYIRALRYGAVTRDEVEKFIKELANYGFTPIEIQLVERRVELEEAIIEARELRRAYLPTPYMLATLAEYVRIPRELVLKTLEARRVPKEWIDLWIRYIEVRPLADEARMLATVYFRAKRYGVPLGDLEKAVVEILKKLGFTEEELRLRELRATIEAMIDQWREAQREYVPTPMMLASIAEVVPEARRLFSEVVKRRRIPSEWVAIWAKYIQIRPVADEIRRYVSVVTRMFSYFAIKESELRKALEKIKPFGYEQFEIDLIVYNARLEAALRAYRELVGTPRQLVTMAECSPTARRLALAQVYKMIDALPVDPRTKEFLKKMWEEFIRVRPVYDEVRRYITELISDYAEGVIDRRTLEEELRALKEWGVDDYEIQFYLWLAERRRQRYVARAMRRARV